MTLPYIASNKTPIAQDAKMAVPEGAVFFMPPARDLAQGVK